MPNWATTIAARFPRWSPTTAPPPPTRISIQRTRTDLVRELLDRLNDRELTILRQRFGLDGGSEKTLEEVGECSTSPASESGSSRTSRLASCDGGSSNAKRCPKPPDLSRFPTAESSRIPRSRRADPYSNSVSASIIGQGGALPGSVVRPDRRSGHSRGQHSIRSGRNPSPRQRPTNGKPNQQP
jgi:hypothetical protein